MEISEDEAVKVELEEEAEDFLLPLLPPLEYKEWAWKQFKEITWLQPQQHQKTFRGERSETNGSESCHVIDWWLLYLVLSFDFVWK